MQIELSSCGANVLLIRPQALKNIDLSCNPIQPGFANITAGLSKIKIHTLLLDNIYRIVGPGEDCSWLDLTDQQISPVKSTPLRSLSFQANQLGAYTDLKLRRYCTGLIYLDVSLNSFYDTLFHRYNVIEGQPIEAGARSIFHTVYFQLTSLQYIGLRKLSRQPCDLINNAYLNCDKDGDLFFNDDHYWDFNINPNIMDFLL